MWDTSPAAAAYAQRAGLRFAELPPNNHESLEAIGVREASCIMPVTDDDRLNLQIALKARDLNPAIRIVLRQFNRRLGRKIEQNLPNCSAISPATLAAATFAATALDRSSISAVQFPSLEGRLIGFSEREAHEFGLDACTVLEAERKLNARVIAVNDRMDLNPQSTIARSDPIVVCAPMPALQRSWSRRGQRSAPRARTSLRDVLRAAARLEPVLLYTFAAGTVLYFLATFYFEYELRISFVESLYFVATTMFTVGYGDITPITRHASWHALLAAIAVMAIGVTVGGVFIATIAAALNRAQETALRGLRHIHAAGHIIVCGAGNVGTRVIEFLLEMEQRVVVIEPRPNAIIMEHARARRVELMASDATDDETLAFCDVHQAQSLVAVTDSDTANLEAALGALVYNPDLHVVMRIQDPEFSRSVERNFKIAKSFSASDLTAPVIAGLARFPGSRGRAAFAGETFSIGERSAAGRLPRAEGTVPLYAWRAGNLYPLHDFGEIHPNDLLLYLVPLSQFKT